MHTYKEVFKRKNNITFYKALFDAVFQIVITTQATDGEANYYEIIFIGLIVHTNYIVVLENAT